MNRSSLLDAEVLMTLGFEFDGQRWYHNKDERFSIRFGSNCFFVTFFGHESGFPYPPTVGELEKLFFDRTSKLLF